jgi:hypothetical protein
MGMFDKLFDAADSVLGGLESGLKPAEPDKNSDIIDAEYMDATNSRPIMIPNSQLAALGEHAMKAGIHTTTLLDRIITTFLDEAKKRG